MELTKTQYGGRTRPYRVSAEDGTIEYNADGLPLEQTSEAMCYSRGSADACRWVANRGLCAWYRRFLLLDVLRWNRGAAHAAWRGSEL